MIVSVLYLFNVGSAATSAALAAALVGAPLTGPCVRRGRVHSPRKTHTRDFHAWCV